MAKIPHGKRINYEDDVVLVYDNRRTPTFVTSWTSTDMTTRRTRESRSISVALRLTPISIGCSALRNRWKLKKW